LYGLKWLGRENFLFFGVLNMPNRFLAKTMGFFEVGPSSQEYLFHNITIFGVNIGDYRQ
jgi:hypothetical protein